MVNCKFYKLGKSFKFSFLIYVKKFCYKDNFLKTGKSIIKGISINLFRDKLIFSRHGSPSILGIIYIKLSEKSIVINFFAIMMLLFIKVSLLLHASNSLSSDN